jgi:hypothetical protein
LTFKVATPAAVISLLITAVLVILTGTRVTLLFLILVGKIAYTFIPARGPGLVEVAVGDLRIFGECTTAK